MSNEDQFGMDFIPSYIEGTLEEPQKALRLPKGIIVTFALMRMYRQEVLGINTVYGCGVRGTNCPRR